MLSKILKNNVRHLSKKINERSSIITSNGAARAMLYGVNFNDDDFNKGLVAVINMKHDMNPCNLHTNKLASIVKKNIDNFNELKAFEHSSACVSDGITMGTDSMRYSLSSRELIFHSCETIINSNMYDGTVYIPACDKNHPAVLMSCALTNIPSIIIYGGSMNPGNYKNKQVDIVNAFQSYGELLNGKITNCERNDLLKVCCPCSGGSCGGMYTANSMAISVEAMGMSLPFSSSNPASSIDKIKECENITKHLYNLMINDIKPSDIITRKSIENAITAIIALGGSTNTVIHLIALARVMNINLTLDDFNIIGNNVPVIGNLKPHGEYLMYNIYENGGTPRILKWLLNNNYLHGDCMTVTGKTIEENLKDIEPFSNDTIFNPKKPIKSTSHINILYGTLSPEGCIAKITGFEGTYFKGTARTYDNENDFIIDLQNGLIKEGTVIVIRYQGPKGGPGMPEMLKATSAIAGYGFKNSVAFITDGRFSGGSHGFIIGHITPEAYNGGPIALIENGDEITICADTKTINLKVSEEILLERKKKWNIPDNVINNVNKHSYLSKYRQLVKPSYDGCIL